MFIRLYRPSEQKEIIINLNHISKIEITYAIPSENNDFWRTTLTEGSKNPISVRIYKFWISGESFSLISNPDDPVVAEIEKIYLSAIKSGED